MIRTLLVIAAAALAACTTPTTASAPVTAKGKPSAPVAVSAELSEAAARVTLKFEADAKDVVVSASGVDGLVVKGEPKLERTSFAQGESASFDVAMERPAGRAQLVVTVKGSFGGGSRARVVAFTVGSGIGPAAPGEVMTTGDGDTVRVLPAATK